MAFIYFLGRDTVPVHGFVMQFGDPELQREFEQTVAALEQTDKPLAMAMDSFRNMLMSLLATGDILDTEQLEAALRQIYGRLFPDRAAEMIEQRMGWANQYGWLPWKVAEN